MKYITYFIIPISAATFVKTTLSLICSSTSKTIGDEKGPLLRQMDKPAL